MAKEGDKRIGNKFALGLTTSGRPPFYSDDEKGFEELKDKCVQYFDDCQEDESKATITGLALYLGFSSRDAIYDYSKKKVFSDLIKRAMLAVENSYETSGTAFDIFALKNMNWKDKTEQTIDDKREPKVIIQSGNKELDNSLSEKLGNE